jgi:hypothetical protein
MLTVAAGTSGVIGQYRVIRHSWRWFEPIRDRDKLVPPLTSPPSQAPSATLGSAVVTASLAGQAGGQPVSQLSRPASPSPRAISISMSFDHSHLSGFHAKQSQRHRKGCIFGNFGAHYSCPAQLPDLRFVSFPPRVGYKLEPPATRPPTSPDPLVKPSRSRLDSPRATTWQCC